MRKIQKSISFFWFFMVVTTSFAAKDRAPISMQARAYPITHQVLFGAISDKYWKLDISIQNVGGENFQVDVAKFTVLGSDGVSVQYANIGEIPSSKMIASTNLRPGETLWGSLGFKLGSKDSYPRAIIYETTFLAATGVISLYTQVPSPTPVPTTTPVIRQEKTPAVPVASVSPQDKEQQQNRIRASKEAAFARDSSLSEQQLNIITKYVKLQDQNKEEYAKKKITFDVFMNNRNNLEKQKSGEMKESEFDAKEIYDRTFSRLTSEFSHTKK